MPAVEVLVTSAVGLAGAVVLALVNQSCTVSFAVLSTTPESAVWFCLMVVRPSSVSSIHETVSLSKVWRSEMSDSALVTLESFIKTHENSPLEYAKR